jgi:hypothetical protein
LIVSSPFIWQASKIVIQGREYDDLAAAKDGSEEIDPALKLLVEGLGIGPEALDKLRGDEEGEESEKYLE